MAGGLWVLTFRRLAAGVRCGGMSFGGHSEASRGFNSSSESTKPRRNSEPVELVTYGVLGFGNFFVLFFYKTIFRASIRPQS